MVLPLSIRPNNWEVATRPHKLDEQARGKCYKEQRANMCMYESVFFWCGPAFKTPF